MAQLKVFKAINDPNRNTCIDVFRGIAILSVVLYHFNKILPLGYIGVDLFFVVSGLLIGGILTAEFKNGNKINFPKFFLQRGFKIWPSYYSFLLIGSVLVFFFYRHTDPGEIIPVWQLKCYLFFYRNYTGAPFSWSFNPTWSLCVEEHFYILLPVLYLAIQYFIPQKYQLKTLFVFVLITILAGLMARYFTYTFRGHDRDTYFGTHNRIDALALGVLLNLIITYYGEKIRHFGKSIYIFIAGLLLLIAAIYFQLHFNYEWFEKIYFRTIIPVAFFLMLMGTYYVNLSRLKLIRFIAYYSYNWYLWHALFYICIVRYLGNTIYGLITYLLSTFLVAMAATIFVEEKFLSKRKNVLNKIFNNKEKQLILKPEK